MHQFQERPVDPWPCDPTGQWSKHPEHHAPGSPLPQPPPPTRALALWWSLPPPPRVHTPLGLRLPSLRPRPRPRVRLASRVELTAATAIGAPGGTKLPPLLAPECLASFTRSLFPVAVHRNHAGLITYLLRHRSTGPCCCCRICD